MTEQLIYQRDNKKIVIDFENINAEEFVENIRELMMMIWYDRSSMIDAMNKQTII